MQISSAQSFIDATKTRRSNYTLTDTSSPLTDDEIVSIVRQALVACPSPWNVSSSRAVIMLGMKHKQLFNDVVYPVMKPGIPAEIAPYAEERFKGFAAAAGSVLFFEDQKALQSLVKQHPSASSCITEYSDQSSGMVQFAVWTAMCVAGFGCNLQHVNTRPGTNDAVQKYLQVPKEWTLKAQLMFGRPTQEVGERLFPPSAPVEERLRVIA